MMNKKLTKVFVVAFLSAVGFVQAQSDYNLLNATKVEQIGKKPEARKKLDHDRPLPFEYVDDRDILWKKMIWEDVDLFQKHNYRLYYPTNDDVSTQNVNRSLYKVLLDNIREGNIKEVYEDDQLVNKMPISEIEKKLVRIDTVSYGFDVLQEDPNANIDEYIDKNFITSEDIQAYRIKGIWFFNKKVSAMSYRIVAIAPLAPDVDTIGRDDIGGGGEDEEIYPLFWIFYPDARDVLHHAFPSKDGFASTQDSFDVILNTRDFTATIIKDDNMRNNISINEYIPDNSLFQLREAERIKQSIRDLESDMWSY